MNREEFSQTIRKTIASFDSLPSLEAGTKPNYLDRLTYDLMEKLTPIVDQLEQSSYNRGFSDGRKP